MTTGEALVEEEDQVDLGVLEQDSSQGGEFMLIFIPAPPSMLPVASACSPAPACGQLLRPVWGPWVPTPLASASVLGMAMLGLQRLARLALPFHLQQDSSGGDGTADGVRQQPRCE